MSWTIKTLKWHCKANTGHICTLKHAPGRYKLSLSGEKKYTQIEQELSVEIMIHSPISFWVNHQNFEMKLQSFLCSYLLFLVIFTILFDRIWWRTELVAYILLLPNQHHVMWSFKFPTVQSANTSLLSHLPPPQMHLFTWFFLLWPLATLYYHLELSNSLLHHWGHHKSSNTAVSLTTLPYYHC